MGDTVTTIRMPIGKIGIDRNGRSVSKETWESALKDMHQHTYGVFADTSMLEFGYTPNILFACTELRSYEITDDTVYGDFEILDTHCGKLLNTILQSSSDIHLKSTPIAIGMIEDNVITNFRIHGFSVQPDYSEGESYDRT